MKPRSGFVIRRDYNLNNRDLHLVDVWTGNAWTRRLENAKIFKGKNGRNEAFAEMLRILEEWKNVLRRSPERQFNPNLSVAHVSWFELKPDGMIKLHSTLNPKEKVKTLDAIIDFLEKEV